MIPKLTIILLFLLAASVAANVYLGVQSGGMGKLQAEIRTLEDSNARLGAENAKASATINALFAEAQRWEAYRTELEGLILP